MEIFTSIETIYIAINMYYCVHIYIHSLSRNIYSFWHSYFYSFLHSDIYSFPHSYISIHSGIHISIHSCILFITAFRYIYWHKNVLYIFCILSIYIYSLLHSDIYIYIFCIKKTFRKMFQLRIFKSLFLIIFFVCLFSCDLKNKFFFLFNRFWWLLYR